MVLLNCSGAGGGVTAKDYMTQDFSYALRFLFKSPLYAFVSVITLALGMNIRQENGDKLRSV
ncbi:MAG TPA: hypothetical protein VFY67_11640 [Pyrinomonadaceae bacterium]|nr:hypothetical protein [Pyrinomonadaceae bacterium]